MSHTIATPVIQGRRKRLLTTHNDVIIVIEPRHGCTAPSDAQTIKDQDRLRPKNNYTVVDYRFSHVLFESRHVHTYVRTKKARHIFFGYHSFNLTQ